MDCQKVLDEWSHEYAIGEFNPPEWRGYSSTVPSDWVGMTRYGHPSKIYIAPYFEGHDFWSRVILWHEFCHAWSYGEAGHTGHGAPWLRRMLEKPVMFLLQVPCVFVAVFLKASEASA